MSNTRYLEIDSTYRDRNQYPLAAQFEVPISMSGRKGRLDALDPVSLAAPKDTWCSNEFDVLATAATVTVTVVNVGASSPESFIVEAAPGTLQPIDEYYQAAVAINTTLAPPEERRIVSYKFLGTNGVPMDQAEITLEAPYNAGGFAVGDVITITDPTTIAAVDPAPLIFVPAGRAGANGYTNCILYNQTLDESRPVSNYSFDTHLLELDTSAAAGGPVTGWLVTHCYALRHDLPLLVGTSPVVVAPGANTTTHVIFPATASTIDDFYKGDFLRITTTAAPAVAPENEVRRIGRYFGLDTTFAAVAGSAFTLAAGLTTPNIYVNSFLMTGIANYQIATYDGVTRSGTILGAFGAEVPGDPVQIRTAVVSPAFTVAPANGSATQLLEILGFSYDNFNPFAYTGSLVSQQQMVCYEIELINLILPNRTLAVGRGSRIAFYQYVYVELQSISGASAGNPNTIYSNNPNATRMLFRAPIDDTPTPLISPFVKIDGDGMVQTVKFKPNDNFRFSVRLPNGEVFQTLTPELFSPDVPNPLTQISALFSMKRI